MINFTFLVVGKIKEKYLKDAIEEYKKRLSRYAKIDTIEIEDVNDSNNSIEIESKKILEKIPEKAYKILLYINGKMINSEELADKISKLSLNYNNICFIIGGSNGVNDTVVKKADFLLSFSKFTFPHQLMRVILYEQVYRAITINNNIKYHK